MWPRKNMFMFSIWTTFPLSQTQIWRQMGGKIAPFPICIVEDGDDDFIWVGLRERVAVIVGGDGPVRVRLR